MSSSSRRDRPSHSAGLLLRVRRPDGRLDEFYLAPGLTIGRTLANTIALPDDPAVDRTHARVEIGEDGAARLRCVEPAALLRVDGTAVRDLALEPGVRFRVGRAAFECVPGRRDVDQPSSPSRTACPYCASTDVLTDGEGVRACPACRGLVLPVHLDPESSRPLLVPADYHDFRAERFVARGGMGLVLRGSKANSAESPGVVEAVAIKVMLPGAAGDRREAELFDREVATMGRVRHPNVVGLLDHGRAGRSPFLVLEWVDGPSLGRVIADAGRAGKPVDFATAFRWFEQVCRGLAAIHAAGLVHRDLKPSNILIGPDGVARIADFGIARPLDSGQGSCTTTGHAPGTFAYMAPEQWSAPDTVDGRADMYALGVTFYELLTGSRPVGAWGPASSINPSVPSSFDATLGRLLAPAASERYGDIYHLLSTLAASTRDTPSASLRPMATVSRLWGYGVRRVTRTIVPALRGFGLLKATPSDARGESAGSPISGESPGEQGLREEYAEIVRERRVYNRVSWAFGVFGFAIQAAGTAAASLTGSMSLAAIGMLTGFVLVWGAFGFYALYKGRSFLLGLIGSPFILVCIEDRKQQRLWEIEAALKEWGGLKVPRGPLPERLWREVFLPVFFPLAPVALWLAVRDYRASISREKPRSIYALIWSGMWCCVLLLTPLLLFVPSGAPDAVVAAGGRAANVSSLLQARQYDAVIAECTEAIRRDPGLAEAYNYRGIAYVGKQDYQRAVADFDEAIRLSPSSPMPYSNRAMARLGAGDRDAAISDSSRAIELDPSLAEPYTWRGAARRDKGDCDQAIADLTRAIALAPNAPLAHNHRGLAYLAKRDYDRAIADFGEEIERNPTLAIAFSNRGFAQIQRNELDRALADCDKAIEIDPSCAEAWLWRGTILDRRGDHDRAIHALGEAVRLDPNSSTARNNRGLAHFNKGQHVEALADYNEAVRLNPGDPLQLANRGLCLRAMGRFDEAIRDLDAAIRLNPPNLQGYRGLLRAAEAAKAAAGR